LVISLRIGHKEVRGCERIHVLPGKEGDFLLRFGRQAFHVGHCVLDMACGDQIGLLDVIEHEVGRPVRVLEARIALHRLGHRRRLHAEHLHPARLPEPGVIDPQVHRRGGQHGRVRGGLRVQIHEGLGDAHLVAHGGRHARRLLLRELGQDLRGAFGGILANPRHVLRLSHAAA
jgi:hypothetical protein